MTKLRNDPAQRTTSSQVEGKGAAKAAPTAFTAAALADASIAYTGDVGKITCVFAVTGSFGTVRNELSREPFEHFFTVKQGKESARRMTAAELKDFGAALAQVGASLPELPTGYRPNHGVQGTKVAQAWAVRYLAGIAEAR